MRTWQLKLLPLFTLAVSISVLAATLAEAGIRKP